MRYTILLLFITGCAAQAGFDPVPLAADKALFEDTLRRLDQTTAGLADVKQAVSENTALLKEVKALVEPVKAEEPVATDRPTIWVFYAPFNRPPCDRLKADIEAGKFDEFDVQDGTDYTPSQYPAIRYRAEDGTFRAILGYDSATLSYLRQRLITKTYSDAVTTSAPVVRQPGPRWNWNGDWTPSYEDAARHLSEAHGIDPSGMSMVEMQAAHDNAHNGYSARPMYSSAPRSYRSSCPGGRCPM